MGNADDELLRSHQHTASGFFAVVFEQQHCWQGFFIDRRSTKRGSITATTDDLAHTIMRMFLTSGILDQDSRRMSRNYQEIGVLGALLRDYLGFDYFLIEGKTEGKTLTSSLQTFSAVSLQAGRDMLFETPIIRKLRLLGG